MSQNNALTICKSAELSRAIAELEERHLKREKRLRRLRYTLAWIGVLLFAAGIYSGFHLPHLFWQKVLVVCVTSGLPVVFCFGQNFAERTDRKQAELARILANYDDPAIVWALLPKLESLYGPSYPAVSDALVRVLGRCDAWQSGEWSDEQRAILQDAAKWLADGDTLPDPELAAAVERALAPALGAGRSTLVRPAARIVPRRRRA